MNPFAAEHAQCNWCGKVLRGPHENKVYDERRDASGAIEPLYAADSERVYYKEEAEAAGLRHNVSGSMCTDCYPKTLEKYRQERDAARAKQEAARVASAEHRSEVREQRRAAHERHKEELAAAKAYNEDIIPAERARQGLAEHGKKSARNLQGRQAYRDFRERRKKRGNPIIPPNEAG